MNKILCICLLAGSLAYAAQVHSKTRDKSSTHSTQKKVTKKKATPKAKVSKKTKDNDNTQSAQQKKVATVSKVLSKSVDNNNTQDINEKKVATITRGDVKILEATENIRFLSQQIVKEYLFLFVTPQKEPVKVQLKKRLVTLSNNIRMIASTTKDVDSKDILEFLAYSKDQIAETLSEEVTEENAALMLDYSETLLEGADSIAAAHAYDFSKEERMLMAAKQMEYLVERIMKYYMALHVGFDNPTNREQMNKSIAQFGNKLNDVESYQYPVDINKVKSELLGSWYANGMYLGKSETLFIPKLMLMSTAYLEDLIVKIALYHNQNQ
ncbi:hypothetical protein [Sulfurovum sp. NBC37-1]|uniref:hypothetical protein n=1 Tax=Sulfurovum sp. (strain NBC37-1) TaxID=387093 RepID=UPI0001587B35|nr:hypothetical protein [Sulfurovum sp. NBC37-1]BAF72790.1 hypothetical protein SUN_1843 [Sulfurovum sp. NBC37-1]